LFLEIFVALSTGLSYLAFSLPSPLSGISLSFPVHLTRPCLLSLATSFGSFSIQLGRIRPSRPTPCAAIVCLPSFLLKFDNKRLIFRVLASHALIKRHDSFDPVSVSPIPGIVGRFAKFTLRGHHLSLPLFFQHLPFIHYPCSPTTPHGVFDYSLPLPPGLLLLYATLPSWHGARQPNFDIILFWRGDTVAPVIPLTSSYLLPLFLTHGSPLGLLILCSHLNRLFPPHTQCSLRTPESPGFF